MKLNSSNSSFEIYIYTLSCRLFCECHVKIRTLNLPGPFPSLGKLILEIEITHFISAKKFRSEFFLESFCLYSVKQSCFFKGFHASWQQTFSYHKTREFFFLNDLYLISGLINNGGSDST